MWIFFIFQPYLTNLLILTVLTRICFFTQTVQIYIKYSDYNVIVLNSKAFVSIKTIKSTTEPLNLKRDKI